MGKRKHNQRPLVDPLESRFHLSVSRDANGWTAVDPSSDTHIFYVSSSTGNDNNNGLSSSTPVKTIAKGITLLRDGMPDWLLLKKGDTWHESFGVWRKSGRSASEPMFISSYGSGPRPTLATGNDSGLIGLSNDLGLRADLAFVGLSFYANTRDPQSPDFISGSAGSGANIFGFNWTAPTDSILIEDCSFNYYTGNIAFDGSTSNIQNINIRRNIITNSYAITTHSQGLYAASVHGLLIEENYFDHNGWNTQISGAEATVFNHNLYLNSGSSNTLVRGNIIADAAATGIKAGSGGDIQGNLFLRNPIGISYGFATDIQASGVWGDISGNVFLDGGDINGAPRSYAIAIGNLKAGMNSTVRGNIITGDTFADTAAILVAPDSVTRGVGVNDLTIANNIVYKWFAGFSLNQGFVSGGIGGNALTDLVVRDNDFQQTLSPNIGDHAMVFDPTQEQWSGNRYYSASPQSAWFRLGPLFTATSWSAWNSLIDPTGSAKQVPYTDPDRNMATYNAYLGGTASVDAFLAQAQLQSRQNWRREYTAQSAIQYVQGGFYKAGDVNFDGKVTISDYMTLLAHFNTSGQDWSTGDFNGDGMVTISDLIDLVSNFNVLS